MAIEHKVGDEVWFVPRNWALIIRCKITEVDDTFRKKHPDAYLFYWIDEPVGHAFYYDELLLTREEAEEIAKDNEYEADLEEYRKRSVRFIVATWTDITAEERQYQSEKMLKSYPNKEKGKDWFSI